MLSQILVIDVVIGMVLGFFIIIILSFLLLFFLVPVPVEASDELMCLVR
jgi:hypothetical protein